MRLEQRDARNLMEVAAHRIESGFYAGFNRASSTGDSSWPADFTGAKAKPIQNLEIGALARTGTYLAWLTNQDGALTTDAEALALIGSLYPGRETVAVGGDEPRAFPACGRRAASRALAVAG